MRHHLPISALCASLLFLACTEATPTPQVAGPKPSATASAAPAATVAAGPARSCAFQGVVRSDSGAPVENALVAAMLPVTDEPEALARTDAEGRYCFEKLSAVPHGFTVTAPRLTAAYVDVREVKPAAPGAAPDDGAKLDVQLGGPGFVLHGKAADDKGALLANARVLLPRMSKFEADTFVAETGADGLFEIKLPGGKYMPRVRSERSRSAAATLELDKDQGLNIIAQRLNPKDEPAPEEVVKWIREKAIHLTGVEAEKGLDDMQPLKALVGDARLVALGEATHGTREFFQLKHRMFEFLVKEMGFRAFGIEASFGDCLPLSEYVATGKGDPAAALANQGFWTWQTEEVLALVRWMRDYNADRTHTEKLSFWGIDMQSAAGSTQALLAYFKKVDPPFGKEITPELEWLDDDFAAGELHSAPPAARAAATAAVKKIAARLEAQHAEYTKKTPEKTYQLARIHARVLADFIRSADGDGTVRDRSMAEVAAALLDVEGPGAKMALWAHNGHISEGSEGSMGQHLAKRFGSAYLSFGFAFDEGSFQAIDFGEERRGLMTFTLPSAPAGSLDHTLARSGHLFLALNLRAVPKGPVSDWLSAMSYTRSIGSVFAEKIPDFATTYEIPREHYDALLFVKKTTAAEPTEVQKRWMKELKKGREDKPKERPTALAAPGFEGERPGTTPAGWNVVSEPHQLVYRAKISALKCASGKRCVVLARDKNVLPTGAGSVATALDAKPHRGRKVRVSAKVKVEGKAPGDEAFFLAQAPATRTNLMVPQKSVFAQAQGAVWKKLSVELDVGNDAESLVISLVATGAAKAQIDDIEIEPLGEKPAADKGK